MVRRASSCIFFSRFKAIASSLSLFSFSHLLQLCFIAKNKSPKRKATSLIGSTLSVNLINRSRNYYAPYISCTTLFKKHVKPIFGNPDNYLFILLIKYLIFSITRNIIFLKRDNNCFSCRFEELLFRMEPNRDKLSSAVSIQWLAHRDYS